MDNLLVKKKPIAVDKRAKLDVAECVIDVLHAKKIPAQSTSKETKTVEDLVMNSSSRSNAAETAKFEHGYQAMLEVEEGLQKTSKKMPGFSASSCQSSETLPRTSLLQLTECGVFCGSRMTAI